MRARLTIHYTGIQVDLREILLKDKPAAFLQASPKGTVPVLEAGEGVIAESREIMLWALRQNDPGHWLDMPHDAHQLIDDIDGPFKAALDHTKYAVRFPQRNADADRAEAAHFLFGLNDRLGDRSHLIGDHPKMADTAILPFVRQFANTDRAWFTAQNWPHLIRWLTTFETSDSFKAIMIKAPLWQPGAPILAFP